MDERVGPVGAGRLSEADFVRRVLIVFGLGALVFLAWTMANVLLLAFGAVLVAVVLRAAADVLAQHTPIPQRWSLTVAGLVILLLLGGVGVLFGAQMRSQVSGIAERLPFALNAFAREFGLGDVTAELPKMLGAAGGYLARLAGFGAAVLGALADLVLAVVAGVFIAADPKTYRSGLVKLFPTNRHAQVESALEAAGNALRLWLVGQLIAMTLVGVLTGLALWFIGLPSPFALGLIAGLADFIPLLGPIVGAVPAILIAFTIDSKAALWTILAFVAVQQIEANMIMPAVERRVVAMPPALALFAVVAAGVVFGPLGVIVGFPLAVVAFVMVKKLYVRETLGEETVVPGDDDNPDADAPK